ncbi:hypothetical protein [Bythopirellula polymerisocia]|uniref:Uncharacterized protein n=1 Tax=Bythopirellula polymerisocia TaxID=2528003 RepID=A0A5C6CBX3_9BACT|nr:hypothetical protein [Bythopirellula polymerisocia]TWU20329.1 hypothetical protein Pla144_49760 [Bythopirellula polymerisocia]
MESSTSIEMMEFQGFNVELSETGRKDVDQWACYLYRANCGNGFFGRTEAAALEKALEAVEAGKVGWPARLI